MPTHIDQGIRFEVNTGGWRQLLFITPSIKEPNNSIVRLLPNDTVEADALLYTATLPLFVVTSTEPVLIRSFLCNEYLTRFKNNQPLRLRWMQRYTTESGAGGATWSLDDIKIRFWQGTCLKKIHYQDFNNLSFQKRIPGVLYQFISGAFCPSESKLCFDKLPFGDLLFRRSLIMVLRNQDSLTCENVEDMHGKCIRYNEL